jgi:competence protein ComGC
MKKDGIVLLKKEKGFTLIEMLIVLTIMTSLLLIAVPNIDKNNSVVNGKSCEAMKSLVEGQVETYVIEEGSNPLSISELAGYISGVNTGDKALKCPGNQEKIVVTDGVVTIVPVSTPD